MKRIKILFFALITFFLTISVCFAQYTDVAKNYFWNGNEWALWTSASGPTVIVGGILSIRLGESIDPTGNGRKVVAASGTDVELASSTIAKYVMITSEADNTGKICVGVTGVDCLPTTRTGIALNAGDVIGVPTNNLSTVFIDSMVDGEGVTYIYWN